MGSILVKVYTDMLRTEKDPVNRKLLEGKIVEAEKPKGVKVNG
jgi:hypothetical protein